MCDTGQGGLDKPFVCPQEPDREGVIPGESNGWEGGDASTERRQGELDPDCLDRSRPGSRHTAVADTSPNAQVTSESARMWDPEESGAGICAPVIQPTGVQD